MQHSINESFSCYASIRLGGDWAPRHRRVDFLTPQESVLLANLEGPILPAAHTLPPRDKAGPALFSQTLPEHPACVWALANNHIMDFGAPGLQTSISSLKAQDHSFTGAGQTLIEARTPFIFSLNNILIGVLSRCETQFGTATRTRAGVAALDAHLHQEIRTLKEVCDVVIVSVHAAAELSPWPSPRRQDMFRAMIDTGADIVHGHHAHVPQGWEQYNKGWIFYGLGNLCVDPIRWHHHPHALWSLMPKLSWDDRALTVSTITNVIEDMGDYVCTREPKPAEFFTHKEYLSVCNQPLGDRPLLEGLWQEASVEMFTNYFSTWLGFSRDGDLGLQGSLRSLSRAAMRKLGSKVPGSRSTAPSSNQLLLWYHLFACDSHNDAISTALGVLSGELDDFRSPETARLVGRMMTNVKG